MGEDDSAMEYDTERIFTHLYDHSFLFNPTSIWASKQVLNIFFGVQSLLPGHTRECSQTRSVSLRRTIQVRGRHLAEVSLYPHSKLFRQS